MACTIDWFHLLFLPKKMTPFQFIFLLTSSIIGSKAMGNDELMGSARLTNKGNVIDFASVEGHRVGHRVDPIKKTLSAILLPDKEANRFIKDTSLRGGNRRRLVTWGEGYTGPTSCREENNEGWNCVESTFCFVGIFELCIEDITFLTDFLMLIFCVLLSSLQ